MPEGNRVRRWLLRAGRVVEGADLATGAPDRSRSARTRTLARGPRPAVPGGWASRAKQNGADVCDPGSPAAGTVAGPGAGRGRPGHRPAGAGTGDRAGDRRAGACGAGRARRSAAGPGVGVSAAGERPVAVLDHRATRPCRWYRPYAPRRTRQKNQFSAHPGKRWDDIAVTDILDELAWRGLLAHHTDLDELRSAFAAGPGHLLRGVSIRPHLACTSGKPGAAAQPCAGCRTPAIARSALVGGATGLIGDPKRQVRGGRVAQSARDCRGLGGNASAARWGGFP